MPPAFMSLTRSSTCQQPGRISSRPWGSRPYSSLGLPATAFSATLGMTTSRNCQVSDPSGLCTNRGASSRYFFDRWFLNMSGGSTM